MQAIPFMFEAIHAVRNFFVHNKENFVESAGRKEVLDKLLEFVL